MSEIKNKDESPASVSFSDQPGSIGQRRVRASFNPMDKSEINLIKQKTAELIDLCEELKEKDARLASLAQTAYEEAAMWAVKAATA
jgi:hypothetical protein